MTRIKEEKIKKQNDTKEEREKWDYKEQKTDQKKTKTEVFD